MSLQKVTLALSALLAIVSAIAAIQKFNSAK